MFKLIRSNCQFYFFLHYFTFYILNERSTRKKKRKVVIENPVVRSVDYLALFHSSSGDAIVVQREESQNVSLI